MSKSKDFAFKTDKELLEISKYTVQQISDEKVIFKWVTNTEADSTVKYTPYRNGELAVEEYITKTNEAATTIHEVEIDNFEAGVIYDVELISQDIENNITTKTIEGFETSGNDLPPIISQVQTSSAISPGKNIKVQTIISWLTNELATSKVYYQKGIIAPEQNLSESTKLDSSYTKKHVAVINSFEPGTVYSFRIESIDSGGNTSLSKTYTILSPKQEESVFQVIMGNFESIFGWVGKIKN